MNTELLRFPKKWTQNCWDVQGRTTQKEDMEESLLLSYLTAQCKATSVRDVNDKLKKETGNEHFMHQKTDNKSRL